MARFLKTIAILAILLVTACAINTTGTFSLKNGIHTIKDWLDDGVQIHWSVPLQEYKANPNVNKYKW